MEFKKIGAQKYKNKSKYKNKAKVIPKGNKISSNVSEEVEELGNGGLQSNSYRYQIRDDPEIVDTSRDFSILSKAPINQGNFEFKSDRYILEDTSSMLQGNKYFDLDLNLLNASIATIPFPMRCDIDDCFFSADQLVYKKSEADADKAKYDELLRSEEFKKKYQNTDAIKTTSDIDNFRLCENTQEAKQGNATHESTASNVNKDEINCEKFAEEVNISKEAKDTSGDNKLSVCEAESSSKVTSSSLAKERVEDPIEKVGQAESTNEEDLEQWLEDILDD